MAKSIQGKQRNTEQLQIVVAFAAVAFFFTQGLSLWNDDYSLWLTQAQGGIFSLIGRILSPLTSEPQAWGYSDRPLEVLVYKVLHFIFGTWGTGYFFVKSIIFGLLCGALYRWMRQWGVKREYAISVLGIFALSANTVASLVWYSDFGVYSQLVLALLLPYAVVQIEAGPQDFAAKAGEHRDTYLRFIATFFLVVYFGSKLKGDVKFAPLILLVYLFFFDRKKLSLYAAPFMAAFLATLPWSLQLFKHLPPFLGGTDYVGWTYGGFSLSRVFLFLLGDMFLLREPPTSLLGAIGLGVVLPSIAYGAYRLYRAKIPAPDRKSGLVLIWLVFMVLACGMISPQNPTFQLRYTLILLVPATLLAGIWLSAAGREFGRFNWFKHGVTIVVVAQCLLQISHAVQHRRDMGRTITAIDHVFTTMESKHPDAQLVFRPGYLGYGFRDSSAASLRGRVGLSDLNELNRFQPGNTYVVGWGGTLDARLTLDSVASGCGSALFDFIVPCGPADGAFVHRYVGSAVEVAQADAFDKRGDVRGALNILDGYLRKDPQNHGMAFIAGNYAYRLGDFARMEQIYAGFARYFPDYTAVIYNWALAKQGVLKFAEARKLFEKAYAQVPGDYGIGFNLAETYYKLGKKSRAVATVNELLRAFPNNADLNKAKQRYNE